MDSFNQKVILQGLQKVGGRTLSTQVLLWFRDTSVGMPVLELCYRVVYYSPALLFHVAYNQVANILCTKPSAGLR